LKKNEKRKKSEKKKKKQLKNGTIKVAQDFPRPNTAAAIIPPNYCQ